MKEWFDSLQPRERQLLITAGVILALLMIYTMLWRPFVAQIELSRMGIESEQKTLSMMKSLQVQAQQLQATSSRRTNKPIGGSIMKVVDSTRNSAQLPTAKRIEPEGQNSLRLWIDNAPFDKVIMWLGRLNRQYDINVTEIIVDKQNESGVVNVKMILTGPDA